jgi:hypothetical protein
MGVSIPRHGKVHPHGLVIINDPDLPHEVQMDTLQCCHCNCIWVVHKGSGRRRGFCTNCKQVTCGSPQCVPCIPFEKKLDLYEAGKIRTL